MFDHVLEQVREQEIFSREDTPTEQRVLAGFLYHAGLSFCRIEPFVEVCHVTVHVWYHRLKHLFDPDRDRLPPVAVDETKLKIEDEEVYVWAAVDVDTLEVLHVDVSPGRSSLDALLFLTEVFKHCRDQPVVLADRVEWYDWPLNLLKCEPKREKWGDRSLIEAWFGVLKFRTLPFRYRFPNYSSRESTRSWLKSFAALHNAMLQS